jgi:uncharacterized methyltransferase DUF6094
MALMFRRIARNFARNGYFPTDAATVERVIAALAPGIGPLWIMDPCAGEGTAIAELAYALGPSDTRAFAVEYDADRASHARTLVYRCLHADLMQTLISQRSFGLLWLNPPYGDMIRDDAKALGFKGRARLEKHFYHRAFPALQFGGILVFIVPFYVLDEELVGWITRHCDRIRVFSAIDTQFKQVVILGRRVRQQDQDSHAARESRSHLIQVGRGEAAVPALPEVWLHEPYIVPSSPLEPEHFYRTTPEPEQFAREIDRLQCLWAEIDSLLGVAQRPIRRPARPLSRWHLALALAAGQISGVIRSQGGRTLIVKGHTHKEKSARVEYSEDEEGSIVETRILTDKFVSSILAWDITPGSPTKGEILTIR